MLHHDVRGQTSPFDLGDIPVRVSNLAALRSHLSGAIQSLSFFSNLRQGPHGTTFSIVTFFVTYENSKITEFGL